MRLMYSYMVGSLAVVSILDWQWHKQGDAVYMGGIALVALVVRMRSDANG